MITELRLLKARGKPALCCKCGRDEETHRCRPWSLSLEQAGGAEMTATGIVLWLPFLGARCRATRSCRRQASESPCPLCSASPRGDVLQSCSCARLTLVLPRAPGFIVLLSVHVCVCALSAT